MLQPTLKDGSQVWFGSYGRGFGPTISSNLRQTSLLLPFFTTQTFMLWGSSPCTQECAISPATSAHTPVRVQLGHDFFGQNLAGEHATTTGRAGTCPRR
jgi:hypothetical protein